MKVGWTGDTPWVTVPQRPWTPCPHTVIRPPSTVPCVPHRVPDLPGPLTQNVAKIIQPQAQNRYKMFRTHIKLFPGFAGVLLQVRPLPPCQVGVHTFCRRSAAPTGGYVVHSHEIRRLPEPPTCCLFYIHNAVHPKTSSAPTVQLLLVEHQKLLHYDFTMFGTHKVEEETIQYCTVQTVWKG